MKTKSKLQLTALTMGLALVAASAANAQNLTLNDFLSLNNNGVIINVPPITYPSQDGDTWVDLAKFVAPVANFTGFDVTGTPIAPADLIPLRTTSISLVNPGTGVATPLTGANIYNSDGTLTGPRVITQAGNTLGFEGANIYSKPFGVTQPLFISGGFVPTNARIYSVGPVELQSGTTANQVYLGTNGNVGFGMSAPQVSIHTNGQIYSTSAGTVTGSFWAGNANKNGVGMYDDGFIGSQRSGNNPNLWLSKPAGGAANGDPFIAFMVAGTRIGNVSYSSGGVFYATTSDLRLKEHVRPTSKGLSEVMKIQVSDFNYKSDSSSDQTGFIAQQLHTVFPQVVKPGGEDAQKDPWTVDYSKLTPFLTKAVQELKAEKDAEIAALKAENAKLTAAVAKLEILEKAVAALEGKANAAVTVSLTK